jgi:hypothetical protein
MLVLGIVSFFLVSFSDPGYLVGEYKATIDEKTMKSLEDVKIIKLFFSKFCKNLI